MSTRIAVGDAREKLRLIASESANSAISSPPYWKKRNYHAGPEELGQEPTISEYIDNLLHVTGEVYRVLMPHGTFFLNLGDTYMTQAGTSRGRRYAETGGIRNVTNGGLLIKSGELPDKCLCLIPERIAIALLDQGWIIRNIIVWHKPDCMPESVEDRFTVDFEVLLFCVKNPNYYFKQQFKPYSPKTLQRCKRVVEKGETFDPAKHKHDPNRPMSMQLLERFSKNLIVPGRTTHTMHRNRANGNDQQIFDGRGANMRCVWTISTAGYRGPHFATFPEKLVETCIDAGCPIGGTVLDPFLGSGTTALVAERMGRTCIGIELNPDYAEQAKQRIIAARQNPRRAEETGTPLPQIHIDTSEDEYIEW